jgi:P27 family predicted phage terminase small subunit
MKRGPKPTPTQLKKLRGNPGRRPLPKNEPKPRQKSNIPRAPAHLNKVAQKEWRRMAKELYPLGLLTNVDLSAFAAYCTTYAIWLDAQVQIDKHGVLIKAQSGFPMQSPYLTISNRAMTEMRKWLVEFGCSPSSRSRVIVTEKPRIDPLAEFQAKGKKLQAVR